MTINDLTGQKFGRLTVVELVRRRRTMASGKDVSMVRWICLCECGTQAEVDPSMLRGGRTVSCGCYRKERAIIHGQWDSKAYRAWAGMLSRCNNPKAPKFPDYGGRGIKVDPRLERFEDFYSVVGEPKPGQSIDRIDNNGDYEPNNIRWASRSEQQRNRRANHLITHNGETKCLIEWAESTGVRPGRILWRLRNGWPVSLALSSEVFQSNSKEVAAALARAASAD